MNYVTGAHGVMVAKGEVWLDFRPPTSKVFRLILHVLHAGPVQRLRHYRHKNVASHVTARTQDKRRKTVRDRTLVESFRAGNIELLIGGAPIVMFDPLAIASDLEGPMIQEGSVVRVLLSTRAPIESVIVGSLVTRR